MEMTRKSLAFVGLMVTVCFVATMLPAQVSRIPAVVSDDSAGEDETIKMQAKLVHAQNVLEGLVNHDFDMIEKAAAGLKSISLTPVPDLGKAGDRTDEQVYEHFRLDFARLAGRLEVHAQQRAPEATAYVYQNLTDTCIACHDYIRDYAER
jgi:hypothetical protein